VPVWFSAIDYHKIIILVSLYLLFCIGQRLRKLFKGFVVQRDRETSFVFYCQKKLLRSVNCLGSTKGANCILSLQVIKVSFFLCCCSTTGVVNGVKGEQGVSIVGLGGQVEQDQAAADTGGNGRRNGSGLLGHGGGGAARPGGRL
ncbi:unnamed protein product, partial [Urochloa humidicola]